MKRKIGFHPLTFDTVMVFILILLLSLVAQFFLPWWVVVPIAFGVSYWKSSSGKGAFGAGWLAVFVCWAGMALFLHSTSNGVLTAQVSQIFFKSQQPYLLLLVSALIGGLVGGFSSLSGYLVKQAIQK